MKHTDLGPLFRQMMDMMYDDVEDREVKEWGCGLRPDLRPFRLHRGRKGVIKIAESHDSLGTIHTHPNTLRGFNNPPSSTDIYIHAMKSIGKREYYSYVLSLDERKMETIVVYAISGATNLSELEICHIWHERREGDDRIVERAHRFRAQENFEALLEAKGELTEALGLMLEVFEISWEEDNEAACV
jgi:hypothetical protein